MKRLKPIALIVENSGELKLRCQPKLDGLSEEEQADVLQVMSMKAVNTVDDKCKLEAEFSFTFNETGAILQDKHFFALTDDDYGELWINNSVLCLSDAHKIEIKMADAPCKLKPHAILVDGDNANSLRRYKVVLNGDSEGVTKEYPLTVEGKGDLRTVKWAYGTYTANWESRTWYLAQPFPTDLEQLLLAILRLDEAIHQELMPYNLARN